MIHNQTYRVENDKLTNDKDWPYQYWHFWAHSTAHKPYCTAAVSKCDVIQQIKICWLI